MRPLRGLQRLGEQVMRPYLFLEPDKLLTSMKTDPSLVVWPAETHSQKQPTELYLESSLLCPI